MAVEPTDRIRVLFVTPNLGVGGAERHIATLAPALDRSRFDVRIVCIKDEGPLFAAAVAGGAGALSLESGSRQAPRALWRLVRIMRAFRPDIVITRGLNADILGRTAAVVARVPVRAIWKHNCGHIARGTLERLSERLLDPFTGRYFAVAHGQVPYLVEELGWAQDKIRVIHNGVDPDQFPFDPTHPGDPTLREDLGLAPTGLVVGILAVLRPEKDHETFLRAAARVAAMRDDVQFLVVGDGPCRGELEQLAADLGIAERVIFAGMRSDVEALLGVIDLAVLSSYTIECFPYAILEAMAMGVPAVCTAVGGLPELIEEGVTGHLVPPHDPGALAAGIAAAIGDADQLRRLGLAARQRLERHFTLARSARATEAAIAEATGHSAPTRA